MIFSVIIHTEIQLHIPKHFQFHEIRTCMNFMTLKGPHLHFFELLNINLFLPIISLKQWPNTLFLLVSISVDDLFSFGKSLVWSLNSLKVENRLMKYL